MIDHKTLFVILGILAIVVVLVLDKMRPGFTLLSGAILFMAVGVISPEELIDGFSSKEMITIAMLFLIGEGVRQSGALSYFMRRVLPRKNVGIGVMLARMLPVITTISMTINNTAVVIIFAPIIKRWAKRVGVPATKFLIPLSYATILGGLCTLIGTSTNMVVNGLMIENGYRGFTMFEIGKVGGIIAVVGIIYIVIFGKMLLPDKSDSSISGTSDDDDIEIVLMPRFPGIRLSLKEFNFKRHYGAEVKAVIRGGRRIDTNLENILLSEGDTLRLAADKSFIRTWRDSSAFHIVSHDSDSMEFETPKPSTGGAQRWLGLILLIFMIGGSVLGEHFNVVSSTGVAYDIFPFAAVVMVIMALGKLFPAKRYTKYISWDILIAIASAFAISKALSNSGINDMLADWIIGSTHRLGNYGVLALLYLVTMVLTELITNNAAVAVAFPVAVALSNKLGCDPMPLFASICIAASASFSSPMGYQTNLIVQGVGGYKFTDFVRIGIWLNLITFILSVTLIPLIWSF